VRASKLLLQYLRFPAELLHKEALEVMDAVVVGVALRVKPEVADSKRRSRRCL